MSKRAATVLFLGSNGFPFGMAAIQRQIQLAKSIRLSGFNVVVLNWKGVHSKLRIHTEGIKATGFFEGIRYFYTSGSPAYPQNFLVRNILKVIGRLGELFLILYYRLFGNLRAFMVNALELKELRYYYRIASWLGVEVIYDYVEFVSALESREILNDSKSDSFDYQFMNYADKFICISPFLEDHLKTVAPGKERILIPPIVDFEQVNRANIQVNQNKYFLFCGSAFYHDVFDFVIQAYKLSGCESEGAELLLIVNGDTAQVERIKKMTSGQSGIRMLSGLSYEDLLGYYKGALALLIPMSDNLQDRARFPFKICEYTAAGRPIITTAGGPIPHYFDNEVNALITKNGDVAGFASGMRYITAYPEKGVQIGLAGYELGKNIFNLTTYSRGLSDLIKR